MKKRFLFAVAAVFLCAGLIGSFFNKAAAHAEEGRGKIDNSILLVPAAPRPSCEIDAKILQVNDGLVMDYYYSLKIDVQTIGGINGAQEPYCNETIHKAIEQYSALGGVYFPVKDFEKTPVRKDQTIRAVASFGGDENFSGYFLSGVSVVSSAANDPNDYNWPDPNNEANKDYNWYKYDYHIEDFTDSSSCTNCGLGWGAEKNKLELSLVDPTPTTMFLYKPNGIASSAKINEDPGFITEATIRDVSGVEDRSGIPYSLESRAYRSVASPIYNSYFASRCGMVFSLSADGGQHWTDAYPGQNIKFDYPGNDLRWKVYMWSGPGSNFIFGGFCSPYIESVDVYYNIDSCHTDHTKYAQDFNYGTIYYKSVPSMPVIKDGAMIQIKGSFDIYIVKYVGEKRYKRLILSPSVFKSYQHLRWQDVIYVDAALFSSFEDYRLVRVAGDSTIWLLEPDGDKGVRRKVSNPGAMGDLDGVYEINAADRNSYTRGADIN